MNNLVPKKMNTEVHVVTPDHPWKNYGNSYMPLQWQVVDGVMHIQGLITIAAYHPDYNDISIFSLPEEYAPKQRKITLANSSNTHSRVDVMSDGTVMMATYDTGWAALDICYPL